jgi:hypothetical protein
MVWFDMANNFCILNPVSTFVELAGSVPRSSASGLASAIKNNNNRIEDWLTPGFGSSQLSSEELQFPFEFLDFQNTNCYETYQHPDISENTGNRYHLIFCSDYGAWTEAWSAS